MTLLELLVALVIAATLAALALPTYRGYLLRAHRFEAVEALLTAAAAQERFHLAYGHYAARLAGEDVDPDPAVTLPLAATTPGGRYRLELRDTGVDRYRALARPVTGQGQDSDERCALFEIEANGRRSARDALGRDSTRECWR